MIIYVLWNDHLCTVKCRTSVQQSSTQILNIISARNCLQNVFSLFSDAYFSVRLLCISSTEALYKWPCAQIWVLWMYCIAFFLSVTLNFSVSALSKFWNSIILMNWWLLIARLLFSYLTEKRYCYVVKCCSRNMFVFVCFSASHLCWTSTFWGLLKGVLYEYLDIGIVVYSWIVMWFLFQMLSNLDDGLAEDGSMIELSETSRKGHTTFDLTAIKHHQSIICGWFLLCARTFERF